VEYNRIYKFSGDGCDWQSSDPNTMKTILGGKGAGLVRMAQAGMPVPPGFTITTEVCNMYRKVAEAGPDAADGFVDSIMEEVMANMDWLKSQFGYAPLVSVRSGAPLSMPGMMDTILNVGLTQSNLGVWAERIGHRATLDSQRRLIQMLGSTAYGVPHEVFEFQLAKLKKELNAKQDTDLETDDLKILVQRYLKAFSENKGFEFPVDDANKQLRAAIQAVFESWMNPRAIEYRKLNKISEDMGTAVNVQAMVFGNMGTDSGTGVLFTRDPSTGEAEIMGEFLQDAQGEDVVAGIRTPRPINEMEELGGAWPDVANEILTTCERLEEMYRDMVDVEFTVQKGKLFILQSRVGKRSARAAFRIAVDLVEEGVISKSEALASLTVDQFKVLRRPTVDPKFDVEPTYVGSPACPGVAKGKPVLSSEDAVNCSEPCVLVTAETTPDDIAGMIAAQGVLTQTGGATSHAAVVARSMDKTCVVGAASIDMTEVSMAKQIVVDGATGRVWLDVDVPVIDASDSPEVEAVRAMALEKLGMHEMLPVPLETGRPTVVTAASWMGADDVTDAVLAELEEVQEPVVLDITREFRLLPTSDVGLLSCFGDDPYVAEGKAHSKLIHRVMKLTVKNSNVTVVQNGTVVAGSGEVPAAAPADYAVFKALA